MRRVEYSSRCISGVGNLISKPEEILTSYDLVFAKGRCALEALAVGCAVILCDIEGLGVLVTSTNVEELRQSNFGWRLLYHAITVENILTEILKYNAEDMQPLSDYIREVASLEKMTKDLIHVFGTVIDEHQNITSITPIEELRQLYEYLKQNGIYGAYSKLHQKMGESMLENKKLLSELDAQQEMYRHSLNCQSRIIEEIYRSTSWRMTSLLRKIKSYYLTIKSRYTLRT